MRRTLLHAALVIAAALIPAAASALLHPRKPAWRGPPGAATLSQASEWGAKVLWIDARGQRDYDAGHITGAILLNEEHFDDLLRGVVERWMPRPDRYLVIYCSSGRCHSSEAVAERLRREMGWDNVYVLGACENWREAAR